MNKNEKKFEVLMVVGLAGVVSAAQLQTIFSDDFSGDLSGWNLNYINAPGSSVNSVSINGSGQLVIDSGSGSDVRGFLMTNAQVGGSDDDLILASGAQAGDVIMRVTYDVISANSPYSGGLLFGAGIAGDGTDPGSAGGTKLLDAIGGTGGSGGIYIWYGPPGTRRYYSEAGADEQIGSWSTGTSHVGHTVKLEWITTSGSDADQLKIYLDDVLKCTVNGSQVGWSAENGSAVGFYLLLDRDVTIDNFKLEAVPEPATMMFLLLGVVSFLRRRK